MSSIEKLGELFRARDNPYVVNVTVGEIISISPMRIKWGDSIVIESKNLIVSNTVAKSGTLKNGDKIIILPDTDFKTWYVIDKVG